MTVFKDMYATMEVAKKAPDESLVEHLETQGWNRQTIDNGLDVWYYNNPINNSITNTAFYNGEKIVHSLDTNQKSIFVQTTVKDTGSSKAGTTFEENISVSAAKSRSDLLTFGDAILKARHMQTRKLINAKLASRNSASVLKHTI